jgi:hypothetical protein
MEAGFAHSAKITTSVDDSNATGAIKSKRKKIAKANPNISSGKRSRTSVKSTKAVPIVY